ncbi:diguanylate cyclase [Variovorax sp. J22G73]|jgi:diguanylate cyclase (GGDEF)-like protein|uniref:sensor domain-containing diguanylate cyclase n=1 Tax=unclassified Variovorax TaxID=663243 RepID=UPI000D5F427A|nr:MULTISPECIES: diguanylate cyclase [unclassified Variovorax]MDM0004423.1 diguanylate cyclase [Variovorax sp. J22R203]MDM0095911.1 diguanylate cyclase [Variovorax sp. J22G73]
MIDVASHGLLAGLMVCGLVLLLVFGTVIHAWYVLACGFALAAFAGLDNLAPGDPLAHWAAAALVLWAACRLQFARLLLRVRHFAPRLDQALLGLLVALALTALYATVEPRLTWTLRVLQALVVASTVLLAVGALLARRALPWTAVLFCAGGVLLLAGISAAHLPVWGEPPAGPASFNLAQAGVIAELLTLAVAVAARIRQVLRAEKALEQRTQALMGAMGTDALTGATSRAGLESRGAEWLRDGRPFSLMMVDLNGFHRVNERHGRAGGDAVLAAIAQRLRQQVRADDMVARLGDDEFAILLAGNPARQKLAEMAIRIETAGATPVAFEGRLLAGGEISMGIACHPADGDTLARLMESAERALRHCKRQRMGPSYAFAGEQSGSAANG